jgi:hypothetical protein
MPAQHIKNNRGGTRIFRNGNEKDGTFLVILFLVYYRCPNREY